MSALDETWLPVVGYEGVYDVSSLGRVKSLARSITRVGRWGTPVSFRIAERYLALTPDRSASSYGRLAVKLSLDGVAKTRLAHQLVAEAFIGPRPVGHQVAHCDGDAANNCAANLRYATAQENTADKFVHGTMLRGSRVANAKLTESTIRQIRASRLTVTRAAEHFGISIGQVSRIRSGKRWGHVA